MTPKQVSFGDLKIGQEFKMSHQGRTYVKIRIIGKGLTIRNAKAKGNPTKKIFIQSTTGVIVNG